jgi:hypothetical protein
MIPSLRRVETADIHTPFKLGQSVRTSFETVARRVAQMAWIAAMVWGAAASAAPEIVVVRDASYCLGIPTMDVGFDGSKDFQLGPNEFIRLTVPPGAHSISFWPAIPEYVPVNVDEGYWFTATAMRLGWRCKFEIKSVTRSEAEPRMARASERIAGSSRERPPQ